MLTKLWTPISFSICILVETRSDPNLIAALACNLFFKCCLKNVPSILGLEHFLPQHISTALAHNLL